MKKEFLEYIKKDDSRLYSYLKENIPYYKKDLKIALLGTMFTGVVSIDLISQEETRGYGIALGILSLINGFMGHKLNKKVKEADNKLNNLETKLKR
jgi:hypothetical protein